MSFDDLKQKFKTMDAGARRDSIRAIGENREELAFET